MKKRNVAVWRRAAAAAFAVWLLTAANAWAVNYQDYPVGERSAGMGGAYMALSDDASGAYYNPAGLGFAASSSFSISGTVYGFSRAQLTNAVSMGGASGALDIDTYYAIPALFGTVYRFGGLSFDDDKGPKDNVVALSIVVPDYYDYNDQSKFNGGATQFSSRFHNQTYWFGPSYARRIDDHFAVGATVYGLFSQQTFGSTFAGTFGPNNFSVLTGKLDFTSNLSTTLEALNFLGEIGVQVKFDYFRAGLVFRTPSVQAWGSGSESTDTLVAYEGNSNLQNDVTKFTPIRKDPLMVGLGLAYSRPLHYAASVDVKYYGSESYQDADKASVASPVKAKAIPNVNVGGEYVIRETVPLQAGFYTNLSPYADTHVDMYGVTFASGLIHLQSTTTLGVNYAWGAGKTTVTSLAQKNGQIVGVTGTGSVSLQMFNVMLATSYRFQ